MADNPIATNPQKLTGSVPQRRARAWISCAVVGALAMLPFLAMLWWSWNTLPARSTSTLALSAACVAGVLALCAGTWRRLFLISFPVWVIGASYAAYTVVVGKPPGHAVALLLSGASWEEIAGLFQLWQQKWLLLPILGLVALYLLLAWRVPLRPIFSRSVLGKALLVLTVPLAVLAAQNPAQFATDIAINPVVGGLLFFGRGLPHANDELRGKLVQKIPFHARRSGAGEEVHVLIVGESARRASWSVYGYGRATTPYLNGLLQNGEAIFLRDAMSDANLTTLAVPMMLTGLTPKQMKPGMRLPGNLFDLAREAGYTTTWLVNQDVAVTTMMGIVADHLDYPPDVGEGRFGRHTLDEVLLPAYRRELNRAGAARLIGMHVMGSHWEYYLRYPSGFQRFGSAKRLSMLTSATTDRSMVADLADAYDNSVLYTDWFLQQVIEPTRSLTVPVTVTFVPDHGEACPLLDGGAVGHGSATYVPAEFEIPAFVWVNAAYRAAHPAKVAALEANASKEIRTHDVFYTVADLMGVSWPGASAARSFASPQFVPDASKEHLARGELVTRP
jgi:glucan phosphoethanolaminetransferase (alkaline phosphatase superfamily)